MLHKVSGFDQYLNDILFRYSATIMEKQSMKIPVPDSQLSLLALRSMIRERTVLAALEVFGRELFPIFQLTLPGFRSVMMVGPEAARFVLVSGRGDLRWRNEQDPVTGLLRHGVLVEDGESHDRIRHAINPALHKQMLQLYVENMLVCTDQVVDCWADGQSRDMLIEMRRIALLILTKTLYQVDFTPEMDRLWSAILHLLQHISPGLWMIWHGVPRPGHARNLKRMDDYLYQIIRHRRHFKDDMGDLLGLLVHHSDMDDELIRDQLLTMLIAGHDTSTALLSWALYLVGQHPTVMQKIQDEVDNILGVEPPRFEQLSKLTYLDQVINETLRLYPPIHLGSRLTASALEFQGYTIPMNTRVMYSIYLTQRMEHYWDHPQVFNPDRFAPGAIRPAPYTFLPFGGGARNCIGAAFAQVEAKIVLARLFQRYTFALSPRPIHAHMGATLEPRPGVVMTVKHRRHFASEVSS